MNAAILGTIPLALYGVFCGLIGYVLGVSRKHHAEPPAERPRNLMDELDGKGPSRRKPS